MTENTRKPLALAIGTAFVATLAASTVANAAATGGNPFTMTEMSSGYTQLAEMKDGKCGEGKCGGSGAKGMTKEQMKAKGAKDGKCGEGKCGGSMGKSGMQGKGMSKGMQEGKCGGSPKNMKEGKCGGSK